MKTAIPETPLVMDAYLELSQHCLELPAGSLVDPYHPALPAIIRENGPERGAWMIGTLLTTRQHVNVAAYPYPRKLEELPASERHRKLAYTALWGRFLTKIKATE